MDNEKKEKMQESYLKLQFLHEQIQNIEKQTQLFNNQIVELTLTVQSLDDFKKIKEGTEILVPINQGMYAKAEILAQMPLLRKMLRIQKN
jgi:prefoldin subunit 5